MNLQVTFKAIPYMTAAGTMDDNILNVSVIGPGTVSQSQFIIDNWPVYPADAGAVTAIASACGVNRRQPVHSPITGATAETQIKFLGDDYDLASVVPTRTVSSLMISRLRSYHRDTFTVSFIKGAFNHKVSASFFCAERYNG